MTLLSKEIEKYFNLVSVDTNPVIFEINDTFKKNGKIENIVKKETYNLHKYNLDSTNISSIKSMLIDNMKLCNTRKLHISKNILIRPFLSKKKIILKELKELSYNNFIVTSSEIFNNFLTDLNISVFIDNSVNDIIIGERTDFLIREISSNEIEFYFDKNKFYILVIN
jgi:hypothetical protein